MTKEKVVLQDPAQILQQYGVHGTREASPTLPRVRRLVTVPLERIRPGKYQKRESIREEEYQQLKAQIADLGLQFTAILCQDQEDDTFYNLMMGGHIRLKAAADLGITEVQAIIQDYDRLRMAKGTYFENKGRQPLTVIEEGRIFQQLQEDEEWSQTRIAQELKVDRSYVSFCMLALQSAPDIQDMLRVADPGRGQRCFYYLRRLDDLGEEKARALRKPIIEQFLSRAISTDQVKLLIEQILQSEKESKDEETPAVSLDTIKGKEQTVLVLKSFQRYEKTLGDRPPTESERVDLLAVKERIEQILARSERIGS